MRERSEIYNGTKSRTKPYKIYVATKVKFAYSSCKHERKHVYITYMTDEATKAKAISNQYLKPWLQCICQWALK